MSRFDDEHLARLRKHAVETRAFFSNAQKTERERAVVRAFLRCIAEPFAESDIQVGKHEPVDIAMRSARFQVREELGGRKRGDEWRERERRWEEAKSTYDTRKPYVPDAPTSFAEARGIVTDALAEKAVRYGARGCATVDALVCISLPRFLWPLPAEPFALDTAPAATLSAHGWRSVSMLFPPYGAVLFALSSDAPDFLRDRVGRLFNGWQGMGNLFAP